MIASVPPKCVFLAMFSNALNSVVLSATILQNNYVLPFTPSRRIVMSMLCVPFTSMLPDYVVLLVRTGMAAPPSAI
eukprot:11537005-Heterocapsa_arctica.AAC.1